MSDPIETFPVKPGDWVEAKSGNAQVAKVRDVYRFEDEVLVDLVFFNRAGEKIGRSSPAMGGPRGFEPACSYSDWQRITEPLFPIDLRWVPTGDGKKTMRFATLAQVLPDREWSPVRRKARPKTAVAAGPDPNCDPETEADKLRFTAQELRDMARIHNVPAMTERARQLEEEAERLWPRMPAPR